MVKFLCVVISCLVLSGCLHLFGGTQNINDPYCVAIKEAPYKPTQRTLDLEKYNNIHLVQETIDGERTIKMSVEDYNNLIQSLTESENFILNQKLDIKSMQEYYDPKRFEKKD